ncbi:unnamed protein product, partial [Timema podura]|nr:unnamed protein product [Timema podura]
MLMRLFLRGPIVPMSAVHRGTPRTLSAKGSCEKFSKGSPKYFPMPEIRRFLAEAMMKAGACEDHALQLADVLAEADYAGHYSHGLNRIEMYVRDAQTGKCDVNVKPCVLKDTVSTAWVEGNNGLGMVVGNFCMKLAIAKAKQTGVGWVVAKGSNHYGIASWYSTQALKKCMLAALGTNPLSLAAPALKRDSFILDMATSAVAVGKYAAVRTYVFNKLPIIRRADVFRREQRYQRVVSRQIQPKSPIVTKAGRELCASAVMCTPNNRQLV